MVWTAPRTWVAAEKPPASTLNTHIRDNFKAIGDVWTAYTPTLGGWTLGNGTLSGSYIQAGKLIHFRIIFTVGSTTTISGAPNFSIPAAALTLGANGRRPVGTIDLFDTSGSAHRHYFGVLTTTTAVAPVLHDGTAISPTVPWTWATGDIIEISGTYEAA